MLTVYMQIDNMYLAPLMIVTKITPIPDDYLIPRKDHVEYRMLNYVIVRKHKDGWQNIFTGEILKQNTLFHEGDLFVSLEGLRPIKNDFKDYKHVTNDDLRNYLDSRNELLFDAYEKEYVNNFVEGFFIKPYADKKMEVLKKLEKAIGKENVIKALEILNIEKENNQEKVKVRKKEK